MVLSTTKKTASVSSIVNQNQGGGHKKSGLPYQIGRNSWASIYIGSVDPVNGRCCSLKQIMTMNFTPSRNLIPNVGNSALIARGRFF
jgi:hypothetical protein